MEPITLLERFKLTLGLDLEKNASVYLLEQGLNPTDIYEYDKQTKYLIDNAALDALNDISNNPENFGSIREKDQTLSSFSADIRNRIKQFERKIANTRDLHEDDSDSSVGYLYKGNSNQVRRTKRTHTISWGDTSW
ncbi:hypothetical protein ACI2JA_19805 [Alkalihalobacillus sp. NPDC078783]|uniref:hypothetical protein n=1 Tax=Streptomyces albidoflavus TaxID=1886 RepID=UPI0033CA75AE